MPSFLDGNRGPGWTRSRVLVVLLAVGCQVTPEQIEQWKGTEKGPAKLHDAVRSGSLAPELRGQALCALVEIGAVSEVADDLKAVPEAERGAVVHAAVAPLVALARGKGPAGAPGATSRLERQGKDGLFAVRDAAAPPDRAVIDEALIDWTLIDLEGRMTAGASSSEKILLAIGGPAGLRLAALIAAPATSEVNRSSAAHLIGALPDRGAREQAGVALVERARKERQLSGVTLAQLGAVGGDHVVAYLISLAGDPQRPASLRSRALLALATAPDPAELDVALRLAGDARSPPEVRDASFDVLSKLGAPAVPGLARLLSDPNDKIRWETVETMVLAGRTQAISAVLDGLPPSRKYSSADLDDFVVRDLVKLGPSALPALRLALASRSWVARLIAARAIALLGQADDVPRLEALAADATRIAGWSGKPTLGSEARRLATAMRARR